MKPFSTFEDFTFPRDGTNVTPINGAAYGDDTARSMHMRNIEGLAEEVDRPVEEIAPLYEDILAHLKAHARVHDYLPILASKNVKHLLKHHL